VARQQGANISPGFTYNQYRELRDGNAAVELAGYANRPGQREPRR
jgi:hypothetical protein